MGPGFGEEVGRVMMFYLYLLLAAAAVGGAIVAYVVPWLWHHVSIGWN